DAYGLSVDIDRLADDAGVGAEARPPRSVTQDHDGVLAGRILLSSERATDRRADTDRAKESFGHSQDRDPLRATGPLHRHAPTAIGSEGRKVGGAVAVHRDVHLIETPRIEPYLRIRLDDSDKAVRFRIRQGTQENAVHEREHRGSRTDAECQRDGGHGGEGRHTPKGAQRILEVRPERLEPFHDTYLSRVLAVDGEAFVTHAVGVAEPFVRAGARGIGREPVPAELLLAHGEVECELVVDVSLDRAVSERESQPP